MQVLQVYKNAGKVLKQLLLKNKIHTQQTRGPQRKFC
jgi:hypothetical protein